MGKSSLFVSMVVAISLVFTVSCVSKEVPVTETYYETEYRTESYTEIGKEQQAFLTPKKVWYDWMYWKELEWAKRGGSVTYYNGYELNTAKYSESQVKLTLSPLSQSSPWGIVFINLTGVGQISASPPRGMGAGETVLEKGELVYIPPLTQQEWLDNFNSIVTDPKHFVSFTRSDQHTGRDIAVDVTGMDEFAMFITLPVTSQRDARTIVEKVQLIWFDEVTKERQVPVQVEKQRTVMQTEKVPIWEVWKAKPVAEEPSPPP